MAKFKGNVKNEYVQRLMAQYFRNTLKYFRGSVGDEDFFTPVLQMWGNRRVEEEIVRTFGAKELLAKEICRDCSEREPRNGRKYGAAGKEIFFRLDDVTNTLQEIWNIKSMNVRCRKMLLALVNAHLARLTAPMDDDPFYRRVEELKRFFKFNALEMEILKFGFVREHTCFNNDPFSGRRSSNEVRDLRINFIAMAIDHSAPEVRELRSAESRLRKYDFLDDDLDIRGSVQDFLSGADDKPLQGRFFRRNEAGDILPWSFYGASLQRHGELLKRMIRSRKGAKGLNILLYGAPGTGKTSFALTLAKELGLDAYEVTHGEENGRNTSLGSRLIGVQMCNEQLPKGKGMMVVDEADQILHTSFGGGFFGMFGGGVSTESEKGAVNAMLDSIRVPTVWISNAPAGAMADSVRRRFDYSICFHELSPEMRISIWRNNVRKLHLGRLISEEDLETFATRYETSAGGITMVLKNLKELAPKAREVPDLLRRLMEPHCELMGVTAADGKMLPAKDYSLEGLNISGDIGLEQITGAVRNFLAEGEASAGMDRPRMNLLLWGPPGTGKTEFVKYLAKTLGKKVLVKMGSDLLSMWVGGTEQNIRNAFREAEESGSILFLDEIDGLVQDRSGAQRSWEVTQVNELLHQMENFKGVMVGATNFMSNLDAAIMRRFTFKLQFDYLDAAGKRLFFERMFQSKLTSEESERLVRIPNLAPGDYRTVRQSLYYVGGGTTNAMRLNALEKECSLKKDATAGRAIGF